MLLFFPIFKLHSFSNWVVKAIYVVWTPFMFVFHMCARIFSSNPLLFMFLAVLKRAEMLILMTLYFVHVSCFFCLKKYLSTHGHNEFLLYFHLEVLLFSVLYLFLSFFLSAFLFMVFNMDWGSFSNSWTIVLILFVEKFIHYSFCIYPAPLIKIS